MAALPQGEGHPKEVHAGEDHSGEGHPVERHPREGHPREEGHQAMGCKEDQTPSRALICSWVASPPGGRLALHKYLGWSICLAMARDVGGCQVSLQPEDCGSLCGRLQKQD